MIDVKDYKIYATYLEDIERLTEANFLDNNELIILKRALELLFDKLDAQSRLLDPLTERERFNWEVNGGKIVVPELFFIFDNKKHKDLICYMELADIGTRLDLDEIPDLFDREDIVYLL